MSKERLNNKKAYIFSACVIAATLVILVFFYLFMLRSEKGAYIAMDDVVVSDPLDARAEIVQEFALHEDVISLRFYARIDEPQGFIQFTLRDLDTGDILFERELQNSELVDGWNETRFDEPVICAQGRRLALLARADGAALYQAKQPVRWRFGRLLIDGEKRLGVLAFNFMFESTGFMSRFYAVMAAAVLIGVAGVCYLSCIKRASIPNIFLFACLFFGCVYSFMLPPLSVPDEDQHFYTAYWYSSALLGEGDTTPNSVRLRAGDEYVGAYTRETNVSSYHTLVETMFDRAPGGEGVVLNGNCIGNVAMYLPGILGITLARLLGLGFTPMLYIGRLFSLFAYACAAYFGIRALPFGKRAVALAAILPISLQQAASFSYDAVILATGIFGIGYMLKYIYSAKRVSWRCLLPVSLMWAVLASSKFGVYAPLLLLGLLIPKAVAPKGGKLLACSVCALISVGAYLLLNTGGVRSLFSDFAEETVRYTPLDIIKDPVSFIKASVWAIFRKSDGFAAEAIGLHLSWHSVLSPRFAVTGLGLILIMCALTETRESPIPSAFHKICFALVFLMSSALVFAAAYTWQPVGYETVSGLQGRYFLPLVGLLLICLRTRALSIKPGLWRYLVPVAVALNAFILASAVYFSM